MKLLQALSVSSLPLGSLRPPSPAFATFEELEDSEGRDTLDAKIAAGLMKIIHGPFLIIIQDLEEKIDDEEKVLTGRQIIWMMKEELKRLL